MTLQTDNISSTEAVFVALPETNAQRQPATGRKVRIAQFGLGPIGIETVKLLATKGWAEVVGGVDIDPAKVGRGIGDLCGIELAGSPQVYDSFKTLLAETRPDVVIHTAGSKILPTLMQIEPMAQAGVSVVSSCEELLYPWLRAPEHAHAIDGICRASGARVVATGVNPGFVLDVLPVCLTGVSRNVHSVYGERVVDASTRRMPLQKKIGSGLDPDVFRNLFAQGKAGHAGFQESAALVCHCLGWQGAQITETCEPVVAQRDIQTRFLHVKAGQTCGLHQQVKATFEGKTVVDLDLKMYLGAEDPHDLVRIEGDPPVEVLAKGGIAGDHATVAALVNAVARVHKARAGLLLMTDLPVPCIA